MHHIENTTTITGPSPGFVTTGLRLKAPKCYMKPNVLLYHYYVKPKLDSRGNIDTSAEETFAFYFDVLTAKIYQHYQNLSQFFCCAVFSLSHNKVHLDFPHLSCDVLLK